MRAAAKANGRPLTAAQMRGDRARRGGGTRVRKGRCSRIGRGQAVADRLKLAAEQRGPGERMRRVVIKARIVRLSVESRGADAHMRYLQRDGTTRDGERGQLYGPDTDNADGREFVERGRADRHQFRFIVAPEDADRVSDLRGFTRDLMRQMETDLGTRLDWVAVDHFNTGHPHSHVVVRGKDDLGKDLIIAQDYITDGMRLRAQERITLELGPETALELRARLEAQVTAERFTSLDRILVEEVPSRVLDLRPEAGQLRADRDATLFAGRLKTLERYGLATAIEPGVWSFSERLEHTLRALAERGDIIKAINRTLAERGEERGVGSYALHGEAPKEPVIGRVIGKHLADELGDRVAIILDGVDGRVHHIALGARENTEEVRSGTIVEIGSAAPRSRPADRNIAALAAEDGIYRPSEHRAKVEAEALPVPGRDYDVYVTSHVRRLEALRRAGIAERIDADQWRIPDDFAERTAAYEARSRRRAAVHVLTTLDLEAQIASDGATWLDRELASPGATPLIATGFGAEVCAALTRRTEVLVSQGHAWRSPEGCTRTPKDLVARLERQEVDRVGKEMERRTQVPFRMPAEGEHIRGVFTRTAQLASGKFAVIEGPDAFALVPWRPVMDPYVGREIGGIVRGGGISWNFTRQRGLGIGM